MGETTLVRFTLGEYVSSQERAALEHLQGVNACVQGWNDFHASVGSFADEHSTL